MTGDSGETRPRSLSATSNTGVSRIPGRRTAGNDVRSRRAGDVTTPSGRENERGVPYAAIVAVAAVATALLATGADAVLTATASVDLTALVRGDPWLIAEFDAAMAAAAALAGQVATVTRVFAVASLAWVGLRLAVRWLA